MRRQTSNDEMFAGEVPGKARPAARVAGWELEELWEIAAELCGDRDPHQVMWGMLLSRAKPKKGRP